jgi:imidazolonepropionase-like amidohydrolase
MKILLLLAAACAALLAQDRPIVLKTSTLFDGKGKTLHNTIIVVEGSKIARVGGAAPAGAITYDLTALTISPGWIDTHSHIAYHFDNTGRYAGRDEAPAQALLHIADNAAQTLYAGFTTIQSPGAMIDKEVREASGRGIFPGPRVLTSLEAFTETSGDAAKLRELVRERKQQGADLIKLFAS